MDIWWEVFFSKISQIISLTGQMDRIHYRSYFQLTISTYFVIVCPQSIIFHYQPLYLEELRFKDILKGTSTVRAPLQPAVCILFTHFLKSKNVFSRGLYHKILALCMYGWYSRAVSNQKRVIVACVSYLALRYEFGLHHASLVRGLRYTKYCSYPQ